MFKPATVVWSKFDEYPYWPSRIASQHITDALRKHYERETGIAVLFFGDVLEYALIEEKNIMPFEENVEKYKNHPDLDADLAKSLEKAIEDAYNSEKIKEPELELTERKRRKKSIANNKRKSEVSSSVDKIKKSKLESSENVKPEVIDNKLEDDKLNDEAKDDEVKDQKLDKVNEVEDEKLKDDKVNEDEDQKLKDDEVKDEKAATNEDAKSEIKDDNKLEDEKAYEDTKLESKDDNKPEDEKVKDEVTNDNKVEEEMVKPENKNDASNCKEERIDIEKINELKEKIKEEVKAETKEEIKKEL